MRFCSLGVWMGGGWCTESLPTVVGCAHWHVRIWGGPAVQKQAPHPAVRLMRRSLQRAECGQGAWKPLYPRGPKFLSTQDQVRASSLGLSCSCLPVGKGPAVTSVLGVRLL